MQGSEGTSRGHCRSTVSAHNRLHSCCGLKAWVRKRARASSTTAAISSGTTSPKHAKLHVVAHPMLRLYPVLIMLAGINDLLHETVHHVCLLAEMPGSGRR